MIYQASAVGSIALDLLSQNNRMRVHSIFNNGFNIVNDKNELIFIGTNKNGYFPFGITVDQYTMHHVKASLAVNDVVKTTVKGVDHKDFMIVLNQAEVNDYPVVESHDTTELRTVVNEFNFDKYDGGDFSSEKMQEIVEALASPSSEFPLKYLVGRGSGLTPSGDDMITGMLFVDRLENFIDKKHKTILETYIKENVTTIVSQSFIKLALQGIFSTKISALRSAPTKENVEALIALGSSSGMDTLYGIYMTLNRR